jgi:N-acetylmuramoyl-L-alanine amidase
MKNLSWLARLLAAIVLIAAPMAAQAKPSHEQTGARVAVAGKVHGVRPHAAKPHTAKPNTRKLNTRQQLAVKAAKPPRPHVRSATFRQSVPARGPDPRPLIVLDAGHGGHDPGAIGPARTQEKHVTLATTLEVARLLRATGRYRIALTRANDRFVPLRQRLAMSRGADMFISIHADASRDRNARGASVYVRQGTAGPARTMRNAMYRGTAKLQETMIDNLEEDLRMTGAPAREARLHVLASRTAPSVLVEIGFISNRKDEAQLRQPRHRATIARAIKDAVEEHFAEEGRGTRG